MNPITCSDIPALKSKILANLVALECGKNKPTKKHRDAAAKKLTEILQ